ncbi:MAG: hypothetical protein JJU36_15205 [Phycisphaeraceae bacterium]|nr:hypothetical protein [Phycisphaeraceae bacterium]
MPKHPNGRSSEQLVVTCTCRSQYRVKQVHAGKSFRCRKCGDWVSVPSLWDSSLVRPPDDDEVKLELVETRLMTELPGQDDDAAAKREPADHGTYELATEPGSTSGHELLSQDDEHDHGPLAALTSAGRASSTQGDMGPSSRKASKQSRPPVFRLAMIVALVSFGGLAIYQAINTLGQSASIRDQIRRVDSQVISGLQAEIRDWSEREYGGLLRVEELRWEATAGMTAASDIPFSGMLFDARHRESGRIEGTLNLQRGQVAATIRAGEMDHRVRFSVPAHRGDDARR